MSLDHFSNKMATLKTVDIRHKKYVVATPVYLEETTADDDPNIEVDSSVQYLVEASQSPDASADEIDIDKNWSDEYTRALIQSYGNNKHKFSKGAMTPISIWVDIIDQAGIKGKSIDMCKKKWRNLLRTYRKVSSKPNLSRGRVIWKYYQDMADVLGPGNDFSYEDIGGSASEGLTLGKRPRFSGKGGEWRRKQTERINQYLEEDLRLRKEDLAVKKQFLTLISQLVKRRME